MQVQIPRKELPVERADEGALIWDKRASDFLLLYLRLALAKRCFITGTNLEIRVCKRPAVVPDTTADAVVDKLVIVADEMHDETPLLLERDCGRGEENIVDARGRHVMGHGNDLVHGQRENARKRKARSIKCGWCYTKPYTYRVPPDCVVLGDAREIAGSRHPVFLVP